VPRFLSQPSACSRQVLGSPDGPRELPKSTSAQCTPCPSPHIAHRRVGQVPEHCWRWLTDAGGRGRSAEETDEVLSRANHVSTQPRRSLVTSSNRKRHDDWWPSPRFIPTMVVTRKTPLPPTPSSRSTSSQAVPRMAKVKVNQSNQPEHSSPLANGKPKAADSTVSNRSAFCFTHQFRRMDIDDAR
jgi:hypothetical protein